MDDRSKVKRSNIYFYNCMTILVAIQMNPSAGRGPRHSRDEAKSLCRRTRAAATEIAGAPHARIGDLRAESHHLTRAYLLCVNIYIVATLSTSTKVVFTL